MDDRRMLQPEDVARLAAIPSKITPLMQEVAGASAVRDLHPRARSAMARAHNMLLAAQSAIKEAIELQSRY